MRRVPLTAAVLLLSLGTSANDSILPFGNHEACIKGPLAQFGQYIGDWSIKDWRRSEDGESWVEGAGARWIFRCLGNGTAIQDFWMPVGGDIGTNLRIYNAETQTWDIAWAFTSVTGMARISAKELNDSTIVMHYESPHPGPKRRITFYPVRNDGWDWKMEFSADDGNTWKEVYRIKASRRP